MEMEMNVEDGSGGRGSESFMFMAMIACLHTSAGKGSQDRNGSRQAACILLSLSFVLPVVLLLRDFLLVLAFVCCIGVFVLGLYSV